MDYKFTLRSYPMAPAKEPENIRTWYELKYMRHHEPDVLVHIRGYNNPVTDLIALRDGLTEMIRKINP